MRWLICFDAAMLKRRLRFAARVRCVLLCALSHRLKEQHDASDVKDVLPRLREEAKDHLHALNTR